MIKGRDGVYREIYREIDIQVSLDGNAYAEYKRITHPRVARPVPCLDAPLNLSITSADLVSQPSILRAKKQKIAGIR